ncbi:MAG: hypothetical protein KatS3mg130_0766 [Candidatus Sumerlaea sp.]|nr:MAG: hypothetical protein KatS3mg130_0766 [Candidatus Sumerlaea sp.]
MNGPLYNGKALDKGIVGDNHDGHTMSFAVGSEQLKYLQTGVRIEIASWFIGKDEFGPICNRARDRNPLLLST